MAQVEYKFILTDKNYNDLTILSKIYRRQWSKFLNNIGQAYFELAQDNPILKDLKLDFINNMYGLKIYRAERLIWQGMIDEITPSDKPKSSLSLIGIRAASRLADFGDILINVSTDTPFQRTGLKNKKIGTEIVQTFFNECKAKENSPISDITIGQIEDPVDAQGNVITMEYQDALPLMDLYSLVDYMAIVSNADFYLDDETKKFYFLKHKGTNKDVLFKYVENESGNNIRDFALVLGIRQLTNHPIAFGTGEGANVKAIHDILDSESISKFKLREKIVSLRTLDTETNLRMHLQKYLNEYKKPKYYVSIALDPSIILFENWELGDSVEFWIKRGIFNYRERKRIKGVTVTIDDTNVEWITLHYEETND